MDSSLVEIEMMPLVLLLNSILWNDVLLSDNICFSDISEVIRYVLQVLDC